MQACPFQVPRYEWTKRAPEVTKCDMCAERQAAGQVPACVEVCPMEATVFGTRDELLAEAHRRIAEDPGAYYPQVYGENEVGGTSVLFLSPVPFAELGFAVDLGNEPLADLTGKALARVPDIVTVGGALLLGIWWITKRRDEVARVEGCCAPPAAALPPPSTTVIEEVRHDG
jgi:formate dehydrogenase iron-sulfur subunit